MGRYTPSLELAARVPAGEVAAIGRLISRAEAGMAEARPALAALYRKAGRAHVIGITGVPGSGKSTLVASLTARLRALGQKIAIIAIDPSSPFSGGSILGDRIRMIEHGRDAGVYIRSMATRGNAGGLARATLEAADILDVAGYDSIIIETVGVGQAEVEIVKASHTTVVVSAPGLGDEIQAIKAGMLEIADIHVVSKCDRSDANRTLMDLKQMLTLSMTNGSAADWQPPVIGTSAYNGEGFEDFLKALARHRAVTFNGTSGQARQLAIAHFRLRKTADNLLAERFNTKAQALSAPLAATLQARQADPYSLATNLVNASFGQGPTL